MSYLPCIKENHTKNIYLWNKKYSDDFFFLNKYSDNFFKLKIVHIWNKKIF